MSENNLGSQSHVFDFRLPIKASRFNRLLRSIHKPGVYKGLTLSFSGSTVFVSAGSIFINCEFNGKDNLAMKIDFDSIITELSVLQTIAGQNEVVYLTFEYGDIIDNYADINFTPLSNWLASPDPNAIVLGEIEFDVSPPFNITGVNYDRKTWGLTNADAEDTINDEVIYSDTDNTAKKWKVKGGNLSNNTSILDFQSLTETAARIPLTNETNTTIIENRLQVAKFDGRVPLGAVIPIVGTRTAANNGGSPNTPSGIPATGIVSDDGFQRCDGSAVGSGATLTGFVPDLTDNRFIQGSTSLGTLSASDGVNLNDNTVKLTTNELPSHNHSGSTGNSSSAHTHGINALNNYSLVAGIGFNAARTNNSINYWSSNGFPTMDVDIYSTSNVGVRPVVANVGDNILTLSLQRVNEVSTTTSSSTSHNHSISSEGNDVAFDIRPKWLSAIYVMRVR